MFIAVWCFSTAKQNKTLLYSFRFGKSLYLCKVFTTQNESEYPQIVFIEIFRPLVIPQKYGSFALFSEEQLLLDELTNGKRTYNHHFSLSTSVGILFFFSTYISYISI